VKGHLIGYQQPEQTCNTIVRHGRTYLMQRSNGLLIAGSSMERVGFDRELDPVIESDLAKRAGFIMPHLTETSPTESWMGFRPASDDLHVGVWHSPRLYLAYGHFRNGILLAPVTAERIAGDVSANWQMP
jgi:glycine oxidase